MPYHQSSAVSVASVLTATTVLVLGYRMGRTHAAWRDVRVAKRAVATNRRRAWRHTIIVVLGTVALMAAALFAAASTSSH
jgi:hypothetical protein